MPGGRLRKAMEAVAAAAVAGWLFHRLPFAAIASSWRHLSAAWFLCGLGSSAVMLLVRSAKWCRLLTDCGYPGNSSRAIRSLFGSYALGTLTPGRVGDLARCAFVPQAMRASVLELTVLDRAFDTAAVTAFSAASIYLLVSKGAGVLTLCLWAAVCVWVSRTGLRCLKRVGWLPPRAQRHLQEFIAKLASVRHRRYLGWALAASALDLLTLFFLLRAFHASFLVAAIVAYPWLTLASGLPISWGGLGPREGLAAWILAGFSVSTVAALNISLLFFALTLLLPSLVGGAWIATSGAAPWLSAARHKIKALAPGLESVFSAPGKVLPAIQREID